MTDCDEHSRLSIFSSSLKTFGSEWTLHYFEGSGFLSLMSGETTVWEVSPSLLHSTFSESMRGWGIDLYLSMNRSQNQISYWIQHLDLLRRGPLGAGIPLVLGTGACQDTTDPGLLLVVDPPDEGLVTKLSLRDTSDSDPESDTRVNSESGSVPSELCVLEDVASELCELEGVKDIGVKTKDDHWTFTHWMECDPDDMDALLPVVAWEVDPCLVSSISQRWSLNIKYTHKNWLGCAWGPGLGR